MREQDFNSKSQSIIQMSMKRVACQTPQDGLRNTKLCDHDTDVFDQNNIRFLILTYLVFGPRRCIFLSFPLSLGSFLTPLLWPVEITYSCVRVCVCACIQSQISQIIIFCFRHCQEVWMIYGRTQAHGLTHACTQTVTHRTVCSYYYVHVQPIIP